MTTFSVVHVFTAYDVNTTTVNSITSRTLDVGDLGDFPSRALWHPRVLRHCHVFDAPLSFAFNFNPTNTAQ